MAIYMTADGVTGSSSEKNHDKWIPIKSCTFPVKRPGINTTPGKVSDRLRSAVTFDDITLTKDQDQSSPDLMKWMVNGTTKKVTIAFCKEKGEEILRLTLTDTLISDLNATVNMDEQPNETIMLDFTKIEMVYNSYDKKNAFLGNFPVGYDLEKALVIT